MSNCAQPILPPHLHLKKGHSRAAPSVTAAVDSISTESVTADSSTTTDSVTRRADTSFFQRALILLHVQPIPPNQARKGRNAMLHNLRTHSRHIIIRLRDNIDELIKQGHSLSLLIVRKTRTQVDSLSLYPNSLKQSLP